MVSMIVHPNLKLLLWRFLVEKWWSLPFVENSADRRMGGICGLWMAGGRFLL